MRDIKFRAWHNYENKMYEVQSIDFFWGLVTLQWWTKNEDGSETHNTKDVQFYGEVDNTNTDKAKAFNEVFGIELMQYTGLKDKNGKEVYEGDIVEINGNECIVKIGECDFQSYRSFTICTCICTYLEYENEEKEILQNDYGIKVIGNIYGNPELLQEG